MPIKTTSLDWGEDKKYDWNGFRGVRSRFHMNR